MNLELNAVQTEVLIRELSQIIQNDRYPLSPRIVTLKEILGQLRPKPESEARALDDITRRRGWADIDGEGSLVTALHASCP